MLTERERRLIEAVRVETNDADGAIVDFIMGLDGDGDGEAEGDGPTAEPWTPKVGDKVRFRLTGTEADVVDVHAPNNRGATVRVRFDDSSGGSYFRDEMVPVLADPEPETDVLSAIRAAMPKDVAK